MRIYLFFLFQFLKAFGIFRIMLYYFLGCKIQLLPIKQNVPSLCANLNASRCELDTGHILWTMSATGEFVAEAVRMISQVTYYTFN